MPNRLRTNLPGFWSFAPIGLSCSCLLGCLDPNQPLISVRDPDLLPSLAVLHTIASGDSIGNALPSRLIESPNLMAGLVWSENGDTLYHQATHVNREWPMRLDIALKSTPPSEAMLNVSGNGRGRFGMALLFLFEDINRNGRYDAETREADTPPKAGEDWIWGLAGGMRLVFISDAEALEWVRAHPPDDIVLKVNDPSQLQVGFNALRAENARDTVFRQYKTRYPGQGFGISDTPPDTGEYETLLYPRTICDGFSAMGWQEEIVLDVGERFNPFEHLVTVNPNLTGQP